VLWMASSSNTHACDFSFPLISRSGLGGLPTSHDRERPTLPRAAIPGILLIRTPRRSHRTHIDGLHEVSTGMMQSFITLIPSYLFPFPGQPSWGDVRRRREDLPSRDNGMAKLTTRSRYSGNLDVTPESLDARPANEAMLNAYTTTRPAMPPSREPISYLYGRKLAHSRKSWPRPNRKFNTRPMRS
jgi:hypothetical protein